MLTDTQIKELSKRMSVPLVFVGFKDELPKKIQYNKSYIINMEDSIGEDGKENEGSHWVFLQVNKYPDGKVEPIYFDSYGQPPPEEMKKMVMENTGKYLPYNKRDLQSLMNNACGYFCLGIGHFINAFPHRTKDLYTDVETFLSLFDDLNESVDWKKNEYILQQFFMSPDKSRKVDVLADHIVKEDQEGGRDLLKVPCDIKIV
jgi:hypothetical protein